MSLPVAAILVAAGQSRRFGTDKLWIDMWGRPVWRWSLDALLAVPGMAKVALVVPADAVDRYRSSLPPDSGERVQVVGGGAERTDSVVAGIGALTAAGVAEETPVLVHDAARPAASPELMVRVVSTVRGGTGAVPVVPVADSLKTIDAAKAVTGAVDRERVFAAQTPQGATLVQLRAAMEETHAWGRSATDEAAAMASGGIGVRAVEGEAINRKLTDPGEDAMLRAALGGWSVPLSAPAVGDGLCAGIGFDAVHGRDGAGRSFGWGRGAACGDRCPARRGAARRRGQPLPARRREVAGRGLRDAAGRCGGTPPRGRLAAGGR
jgi:2-C-methyl-D-erythritol 4-phosphate cytidylyltransferase